MSKESDITFIDNIEKIELRSKRIWVKVLITWKNPEQFNLLNMFAGFTAAGLT